jgi:CxxC motif-containing protein (DUF1111 family)
MSFGRLLLVVLLLGCGSAFWSAEAWAKKPKASRSQAAKNISGREIFLREWLPNDPRSHGGDGLGPVFNDTSCVACHNQGGIGGGGAEGKNVDSISAVFAPEEAMIPFVPADSADVEASEQATLWEAILSLFREEDPTEPQKRLDELKRIHPGLVTSRSVVLHKSGTDTEYAKWRSGILMGDRFERIGIEFDDPMAVTGVRQIAVPTAEVSEVVSAAPEKPSLFETLLSFFQDSTDLMTDIMESRDESEFTDDMRVIFKEVEFSGSPFGPPSHNGNFQITVARRNTTALFGAGLIDAIPDATLEEIAALRHEKFPHVTGRVARLKDGKIGRFGWKAQKASLHDFTMAACAVELGLHVPEHAQAGLPHKPDYKPTGYDLNQGECAALVQFLKELPAPRKQTAEEPKIAEYLSAGEKLFTQIGCAVCHMPRLGEVNGLYSDLLLHDMGPMLLDSGTYGVFQPDSPGDDAEEPLPSITQVQPLPVFGFRSFEAEAKTPKFGAAQSEWRTPPLWGVRDSGPYLHDGRAKTLEQAIALHGGEAQQITFNFFRLSKEEQTQVVSFLRTLVAPETITK